MIEINEQNRIATRYTSLVAVFDFPLNDTSLPRVLITRLEHNPVLFAWETENIYRARTTRVILGQCGILEADISTNNNKNPNFLILHF